MGTLGIILLVCGGVFTLVGVGNFFSSFGSMEPPRYFWCVFVGLPMLAFGSGLLKIAYFGRIVRYVAGEVVPVGTDVVNYSAEHTREGVRTYASSIAEGLRSGAVVQVKCAQCGAENDSDARFCKSCGSSLQKEIACPSCGKMNDTDARFCDGCGHQLHQA
jgi:hypothetical protein